MKDKRITYILLIIGILVLVAINLAVFINKYFDEEETEDTTTSILRQANVVSEEEDEENRTNKIAGLSEKLRMQTYFGEYITYIESGDYSSAYALLYDGFKETYFPSLNDFVDYAEATYPSTMTIEYTDIEREGTIFILTVEIRDALAGKQEEVETTQVVIMENDVNDFYISFEVKGENE